MKEIAKLLMKEKNKNYKMKNKKEDKINIKIYDFYIYLL
jgi:hypothetical protein